ncbi:MAG: DUF2203 domain-containing protein [Verrucomicrobiota bacterium]
MPFQFSKHYTREEARALLPQVRQWLEELNEQRRKLEKFDERLTRLLGLGDDLGGDLVNRWVKCLGEIKGLLLKFQTREIQVKDLERGLIDFPAFVGGKEVFLCWEKDDEDIEYWHDLHTGYAGRERLD